MAASAESRNRQIDNMNLPPQVAQSMKDRNQRESDQALQVQQTGIASEFQSQNIKLSQMLSNTYQNQSNNVQAIASIKNSQLNNEMDNTKSHFESMKLLETQMASNFINAEQAFTGLDLKTNAANQMQENQIQQWISGGEEGLANAYQDSVVSLFDGIAALTALNSSKQTGLGRMSFPGNTTTRMNPNYDQPDNEFNTIFT